MFENLDLPRCWLRHLERSIFHSARLSGSPPVTLFSAHQMEVPAPDIWELWIYAIIPENSWWKNGSFPAAVYNRIHNFTYIDVWWTRRQIPFPFLGTSPFSWLFNAFCYHFSFWGYFWWQLQLNCTCWGTAALDVVRSVWCSFKDGLEVTFVIVLAIPYPFRVPPSVQTLGMRACPLTTVAMNGCDFLFPCLTALRGKGYSWQSLAIICTFLTLPCRSCTNNSTQSRLFQLCDFFWVSGCLLGAPLFPRVLQDWLSSFLSALKSSQDILLWFKVARANLCSQPVILIHDLNIFWDKKCLTHLSFNIL